ncbi:hypothetical protein M5D96_012471 [Drosophila gunungcola]|uniref:Uncharacterized protein n=1 Tax=Drosophila gunungcola TaxID=103775 RepID=A0A9Q0BJU3_9MUSC|nr:hypothetical protein M5D96_012471 [Drosophila gunungcola]
MAKELVTTPMYRRYIAVSPTSGQVPPIRRQLSPGPKETSTNTTVLRQMQCTEIWGPVNPAWDWDSESAQLRVRPSASASAAAFHRAQHPHSNPRSQKDGGFGKYGKYR